MVRVDHPGSRVGPPSRDWCPYEQRRAQETQTTEAETGVEAATGQGTPPGGTNPAGTLTSDPSLCERIHFNLWSFCGILLQQRPGTHAGHLNQKARLRKPC